MIKYVARWLRTHLLVAAGGPGVLILIGLCVVGYQATIRSIALRLTEEHNVVLATAVAHELETEIAALFPDPALLGDVTTKDIVTAVVTVNQSRLLTLLQDRHVHYFDIHDLSGEVVYTSHTDTVGSSHVGNRAFETAGAGTVTTQLDDNPADTSNATSPHIHLIIFAPIRRGSQHAVLGVLGLYGVVDPGTLPYQAMQLLIAATFAFIPITLLALGGIYLYRRNKYGRSLLGAGPEAAPSDDAVRYHAITAQETERKRISRDLHDGIGQYLNAIKIHLQNITTDRQDRLPADAREEIEGVVRVVSSATDEVRRISLALRPTMLDDLGLLATLNWLCREFSTVHPGIAIEKRADITEDDIPDHLKTTLYRIVQEALTNVAKHSQATHVDVILEKIADSRTQTLQLTIVDNGIGFDPAKMRVRPQGDGGLGLSCMRERAEFDGGALRIRSEMHAGTRIQASWPLPKT